MKKKSNESKLVKKLLTPEETEMVGGANSGGGDYLQNGNGGYTQGCGNHSQYGNGSYNQTCSNEVALFEGGS